MIRTDELRRGRSQIQFSLAALGDTKLQPRIVPRSRAISVAQSATNPYELNLSGIQVLLGLLVGVCFVSLFVWGLVRYLLFAQ
jgi:hypothetical protein